MSKKLIITSAITFVAFAPFAFAESHPIDSPQTETRKEKFVQKLEDKKLAVTERIEKREEFNSLQQNKIKALRAEFKAKHDEFKANILELKDQRKKIIVERVDSRLVTINQNWAQRMNEAITKLETLLAKFSDRSAALKAGGQDTTTVDAAIVDAETAIQAAKDAVAQQEAKEYVADLTDENNLKTSVGGAMSELRNDLKIAHDIVKTAKQKVIDVARSLAKINKSGVQVTPEPTQTSTPSATVTPEL